VGLGISLDGVFKIKKNPSMPLLGIEAWSSSHSLVTILTGLPQLLKENNKKINEYIYIRSIFESVEFKSEIESIVSPIIFKGKK
jgi:hypothetical protein